MLGVSWSLRSKPNDSLNESLAGTKQITLIIIWPSRGPQKGLPTPAEVGPTEDLPQNIAMSHLCLAPGDAWPSALQEVLGRLASSQVAEIEGRRRKPKSTKALRKRKG